MEVARWFQIRQGGGRKGRQMPRGPDRTFPNVAFQTFGGCCFKGALRVWVTWDLLRGVEALRCWIRLQWTGKDYNLLRGNLFHDPMVPRSLCPKKRGGYGPKPNSFFWSDFNLLFSVFVQFLKATVHVWLFQNFGCIPYVVQYILVAIHPEVCAPPSYPSLATGNY